MAGMEPLEADFFGLHYGPVVLGDMGRNRLEFAIIGNTVNEAARLESATRDLGTQAVIREALAARVLAEGHGKMLDRWDAAPAVHLKGVATPMPVRVMRYRLTADIPAPAQSGGADAGILSPRRNPVFSQSCHSAAMG